MKKYLQVTLVITIFGFLVFLKQVRGSDETPIIGASNKLISPTASSSPISQTPAPVSASTTTSSTSPSVAPIATPAPTPQGKYKNGTYTGSVQDAFYGNLQVQAVISGGKITDVIFLQYPNDNRTSLYVNSQADPMLKQEAIQAQSAQVDIVSGASASSQAFQASLADALSQAK